MENFLALVHRERLWSRLSVGLLIEVLMLLSHMVYERGEVGVGFPAALGFAAVEVLFGGFPMNLLDMEIPVVLR